MMAVLIPAMFMSSCKKTDDNQAFETLKTYMQSNSMDLPDMLTDWIMKDLALVDSVQNDADATNDYYIIDIRSAEDFAKGHINGAVNCKLTEVLDKAAEAGSKKILCVCYTGQTAGHANMALRLKGYSSQVLLWGMSGWNADFDKWTPNVGQADLTNWEAAPGNLSAIQEFGYPVISTDATDGETILDERITALLAGGLRSIKSADVLANYGDYFINNYWAEADVQTYGHIKGAYRINPLSLDNIKNIDPDATVVTYCWTGQTSSMVTAWLFVLGYDTKSLLFGANSMIHDDLQAHKWMQSGSFTYVK